MKLLKLRKAMKALIASLRSYIPEVVPTTDDALEAFVADVCVLAGYPLNDGTRHAVATTLSHVDIRKIYVSKRFVINSLKRAAAQQAAFNMIQDTKRRQKAAQSNEETV